MLPRAEAMMIEMQLRELRNDRGLTKSGMAQVIVSRQDRVHDVYFDAFRTHIEALGGELTLVASFPDADVRVHPFEPAR